MRYPAMNPVAVEIGPWQLGPVPLHIEIRWYGLMYVISFVMAYFLIQRQARRQRLTISADDVSDLLFYLILGVLLGGRVGYILFYNVQQYLTNPLEIVAIWHGGMSFHGGLIGVIFGTIYFVRKKKVDFWHLADVVTPVVPLGLLLGRMGNFINGELWGRPTTVPWGMVFPMDRFQLVRHPSQLYEAFFEGFVLWAILWTVAALKKRPRGILPGLFICGYGVARYVIEYFREPDEQLGLFWGLLSMGQILCLAMIGIGLAFLAVAIRRHVPAYGADNGAGGATPTVPPAPGGAEPPSGEPPRPAAST